LAGFFRSRRTLMGGERKKARGKKRDRAVFRRKKGEGGEWVEMDTSPEGKRGTLKKQSLRWEKNVKVFFVLFLLLFL